MGNRVQQHAVIVQDLTEVAGDEIWVPHWSAQNLEPLLVGSPVRSAPRHRSHPTLIPDLRLADVMSGIVRRYTSSRKAKRRSPGFKNLYAALTLGNAVHDTIIVLPKVLRRAVVEHPDERECCPSPWQLTQGFLHGMARCHAQTSPNPKDPKTYIQT